MKKAHVNIGILGAGHGKTTLTEAITKVLSLQGIATEKNQFYISWETKKGRYSLVDVECVRSMINGSVKVDKVILFVSAVDGAMPQTREHILLSRQVGISNIVVFVTNVDKFEGLKLELVEKEVRGVLNDYDYAENDITIIHGSLLEVLKSVSQDINAVEYTCINQLVKELYKSVQIHNDVRYENLLMSKEETISLADELADLRKERGILSKSARAFESYLKRRMK